MWSIRSWHIAFRILVPVIAVTAFSLPGMAQQKQDFPLVLPDDDFGRTRGFGDITKGVEVFRFKPTFRLKRVVPKPKRVAARPGGGSTQKSKYSLPDDAKSAEQWETIGVTVWRVSPDGVPTADGKDTARLMVQESGKEYSPIRANADTVFKLGDKVRLSVESPRQGYLYIIDREMLGGDKLGAPAQIFPTMSARGGNNQMQAGWLTDIPAQTDRIPYFELASETPGYQGEMLTIIYSPTPLKDMTVPAKPDFIAAGLVDEMEKRYLHDAAEYEQQGSDGKGYTKVEKDAGGDGKRQLTQNDPYPQTKYRVKVRPKEPMMINIALSVK